jgi:hypothetical protein
MVESLYPSWLTSLLKFLSSGGWIPVAIVLVGGTVAAGFRFRRRSLAVDLDSGERGANEEYIDPLQQSVAGVDEASNVDTGVGSMGRWYLQGADEIRPKLIWSGQGPSPVPGNSIEINTDQVIIGSDAEQCEIVISSVSISPKHASLVRNEGGAVRLADLGSESGTWVNFAPVSSKGIVLNNGDIVQIGKLNFRYQIGGYREDKYAE